jgi:hypothetical protein
MVDHCLYLHTLWAIGAQDLTLNYCILGHPNSKAIDLQIPTHQGQTCMDAIPLALQTVGCREGRLSKQSAGTQVFTSKFLPREPRRGTIWGAACLAKDTEIRLADGTFASAGNPIWTDQQIERRITRLHKFDTDEGDPPLFGIGGTV